MQGYTIAERLRGAGWTWPTDEDASRVVSGASIGRDEKVTPRSRSTGPAVTLRALLPAGARVMSRGEDAGEMGIVEYDPKSGYIRLRPTMRWQTPQQLLAGLVDVDAAIVEPS